MFLWIGGFLKGDDEDDSLKFELTVRPEFETAIMAVLGWKSLDESADGEWLLTREQIQQIATELDQQLPTELDLFIGVRE
ncbi:pyocin S6 family toxin immunity protein [Pseudomonas sp. CLCA07]